MPATEAESHSQAQPQNTATTQDKTILRGARKTTSPKNVYIKNVKEVDLSTLKCMKPNVNDVYFVRLKSDDEGGSKEKRQDHIDKIFDLCCTHSRDAAGNEFEGIEVRFEQAMPAYAGHFNPVVVSEIEAHKDIVVSVDKRYKMSMRGERPSRNWGTARISLEKDEWKRMPIDSTKQFGCGEDEKVYRYRCGESLGKGVTIYIIDDDGFMNLDFVKDPNRVEIAVPSGGGNKPEGHGTVVTNIAAGDTCGVAPEASVWLWSPEKPGDSLDCQMALERILQMEDEKHQAWKSDTTKTYYSVLNISFTFRETDSKADPAKFKTAMANLSDFYKKLLARGVFTVMAAGNDGEEIDSLEDLVPPGNLKDVFRIGASDRTNQIRATSNYGPGVIAYAPGEDIRIIGSTKTEKGTSFAAPHVSGLLACLLSSELAQKPPPKSAEQKRWTIGDVCTKLQKSFSHAEHEFRGFPINVIFNKIVITDLRIVKMNDSHSTLFLPWTGVAKFVTLQDLVRFCNLLKTADYTGCDLFFETTLKIENATQSCLRAVRSVTVISDGKSHTEATGGTDGLADTRVASFFGNWLPKQLTAPK